MLVLWIKVVSAFGECILQPDGEVDRPKLGRFVFSDPEKCQLLNQLFAPYISFGIFWEILKLCMKGFKLQRLMLRDRTSEDDARNRINAQMPLDLKRTKADIVVVNTGSLEVLK
ncbi:hypothetical protein M0R45_024926 [Rubus argutus]|uniref:Uncharacterized protein n=1 Tax=Rubus argutus TaxID=59490 RepID=A0AAW1WSG3_RUBAR